MTPFTRRDWLTILAILAWSELPPPRPRWHSYRLPPPRRQGQRGAGSGSD